MAYLKRHRVNVVYTALNAASQAFYTDPIVNGGWIESIVYNRATASALTTGAKLVFTAACSSAPILTIATASADAMVFYPHARAQDTSGAGLFNATEASAGQGVPCKIPIGQERVKIEVTSGGASGMTGGALAYIDLYISGA